MKNKKGFTLVEVLAVVVLLGVLAGIAMPTINKYIDEARKRYNKQVENQLLISGKAYFSANRNLLPRLTYIEKFQEEMVENKSYVTAPELTTGNYLKENLVNYDGESCQDSYVTVVKRSTSKDEEWYPCLICGEGNAKKTYSENGYCSLNANWEDKEKPFCTIVAIKDNQEVKNETDQIFKKELATFKFTELKDPPSGDNDKNYLSILFKNHTTGTEYYERVSNKTQADIKDMDLKKHNERRRGIFNLCNRSRP